MGVFHVALGGGEALELDYLFAVAAHAVEVGIVPNLTTSGLGMTAALAERCRVFGQINVSVDGVGAAYQRARGFDGFRHAERALKLLRGVKEEVGINCVVSRSSFDGLRDVARLAKRLDLSELELLRFKPVGRGLAHLDEELTLQQAKEIYPLSMRLAARFRLRVKLDCSFAPMVFFHKPSQKAAAFFGVQGCVAGDVLAAVTPEGRFTGCSFCGSSQADARVPGSMQTAWGAGFREKFRDHPRARARALRVVRLPPPLPRWLPRGRARARRHGGAGSRLPDGPGAPREDRREAARQQRARRQNFTPSVAPVSRRPVRE